jgi:hypothetical protein
MHRITPKVLSIALLISSVAYGQSLGDVARENREKQKAKAASSAAKPKVITNENLPAKPEATPSEIDGETKPAAAPDPSGGMSAEHMSPEEWKSQILGQKNAIAMMQAQIDKVNDSIHYVTASLYSNGLQYNDHQAKKQQSVEQMKQQLEEQKKTLAQMQEAARAAGMGSAVYDP